MADVKATTGLEEGAVTAVPVSTATASTGNGVPMYQQEKLGGKCCGCCCDYRRAVIILAIVSIIFGILGLVGNSNQQDPTSDIDDDGLAKELEDIADSYATGSLVMGIIGFVMAIVALAGGIMFNWMMVGISALYVIISFVVGIILAFQQFNETFDALDERDFGVTDDEFGSTFTESDEDALESFIRLWLIIGVAVAAIITFLFVYPSFCFIKEVRAGILTKETYPREEHSCCCTSSRQAS